MTIEQIRASVDEAGRTASQLPLADNLVSLAGELVRIGDLASARTALDEAAAINERANRAEDERHCRQFGATLSRLLGDFDGSRTRALRAARLSATGSPAAVSAQAELGEAALASGDPAAGARAFGSALDHARTVGLDAGDRSGLLRKQAAALAASGQLDAGLAALDQACGLLQDAGERTLATRVQVEAATALQDAGRGDDAQARRICAFHQAGRAHDQHALADLELLESAAALQRNDAGAALAAAVRARDHALRAAAPISYIAAAVAMTELYHRAGDRANVYATLATGYATLGDLMGREASHEVFAPKLREYHVTGGVSQRSRPSNPLTRRACAAIGCDEPPTRDPANLGAASPSCPVNHRSSRGRSRRGRGGVASRDPRQDDGERLNVKRGWAHRFETSRCRGSRPRALVRHPHSLPPRENRPRRTDPPRHGGLPPDHRQVEPVEGPPQIDWPLFPGYCFARFDTSSSLTVLKCSGVVTIVSTDGQPAPIPAREIEGIRKLVSSDLQYDPCPLIKEGTMVEVVGGPLRGVIGRLVRKGAHARLVLAVDLIGQAVSVEVDAADVRNY